MSSLVPCLLLGAFGAMSFVKKEKAPPFFSGVALAVLGLLYVLSPYKVTNWYHVNSRLIPYIFFALLLRVPDRELQRGASPVAEAEDVRPGHPQLSQELGDVVRVLLEALGRVPVTRMAVCLQLDRDHAARLREEGHQPAEAGLDRRAPTVNQDQCPPRAVDLLVHRDPVDLRVLSGGGHLRLCVV